MYNENISAVNGKNADLIRTETGGIVFHQSVCVHRNVPEVYTKERGGGEGREGIEWICLCALRVLGIYSINRKQANRSMESDDGQIAAWC